MLSPIYVDSRVGSGSITITRTYNKGTEREHTHSKHYKGLYQYPPLNTCTECKSPCHEINSTWLCTSNPNHSTLCEISSLSSADCHFLSTGNPSNPILSVGIEVKSLSDLISSLKTGRLFDEQIPKMQRYDIRYLIYYGMIRVGPDYTLQSAIQSKSGDPVSWQSIDNNGSPLPYFYLSSRLTTLMNSGINVINVPTIEQCCVWIYNLHKWHNKSTDEHLEHLYPDTKFLEPLILGSTHQLRKRLSVARRLPGIGSTRVMAVAHHFRSILSMMNAPIDEWMKVDGIGKGIAKSIYQWIREEEKKG